MTNLACRLIVLNFKTRRYPQGIQWQSPHTGTTTQSPSREVAIYEGVFWSEVSESNMRSSNLGWHGVAGVCWTEVSKSFIGGSGPEYPILRFLTTFSPTRSSLASQIVSNTLCVWETKQRNVSTMHEDLIMFHRLLHTVAMENLKTPGSVQLQSTA